MASSYSTDLKIELMVTGENAGTWGDKTNANLNVIQQAIAGFKAVSIAGGAQTTNLLINNSPDIATSDARNAVIKLTGVITGNQIVTVPTGIEKTYIVQNGTTGAFTVQFIQSGGTGTTFSTTDKGIKILFADGTNINAVDLSTLSGTIATAQIADLAITSAKLASFAVTSARLASFAVTSARLATNAVTGVKITQSTITQSKLATGSVGADQLIATAVTPGAYTLANITVDADGRVTAAASGTAGGGLTGMTVYNTGSGTFTIPSGVTKLKVTVVGGGGGGAAGGFSSNPTNGSPQFGSASGGASGGAAVKFLTVTPGNTLAYQVGAGGTSSAGTGGTSSVSSGTETITTISATGGQGGQGNTASPGSGSNGDIQSDGERIFLVPGLGGGGSIQTQGGGSAQFAAGRGGDGGTSGAGVAGGAGAIIFDY